MEWTFEYIDGRNGFYIHALRDIVRGEELFGNYIEPSLDRTMIIHGFYNSDLEDEELKVKLAINRSLSTSDPLLKYKLVVLGLTPEDPSWGISAKANFDSDDFRFALAVLRVVTFDDADNFIYLRQFEIDKESFTANDPPPFNSRTELILMNSLATLCH